MQLRINLLKSLTHGSQTNQVRIKISGMITMPMIIRILVVEYSNFYQSEMIIKEIIKSILDLLNFQIVENSRYGWLVVYGWLTAGSDSTI